MESKKILFASPGVAQLVSVELPPLKEDEDLPSREAAFVIIATMGLGGVRKLELELGESAMVMGLGLSGTLRRSQFPLGHCF